MKMKMKKVDEDDGYLVMKITHSSHESYLVIKAIIVKEVMTCDVSNVTIFKGFLNKSDLTFSFWILSATGKSSTNGSP